jgi:hypothetical protein
VRPATEAEAEGYEYEEIAGYGLSASTLNKIVGSWRLGAQL